MSLWLYQKQIWQQIKILFTDTDSLVDEIDTKIVGDNFSENKEIFDFSKYLAESKYYNDSNAIVVCKMKDEVVGVAIEEFVLDLLLKCTWF